MGVSEEAVLADVVPETPSVPNPEPSSVS